MSSEVGSARSVFILGLLLAALIASIYLVSPPAVSYLQYKTLDWVMENPRSPKPSGSVVIVDIDDKCLAKFGQWPWPRDRLALLLKKIAAAGAKTTALTILLSEPDRTSPVNLRENVSGESGDLKGRGESSQAPLDHDVLLAEILKSHDHILGFEFLFKEVRLDKRPCGLKPLSLIRLKTSGIPLTEEGFFRAQGAVCSLELFSKAAPVAGFLNAAPDSDGILRRMPLLIRYDDHLYPSLALATLMQANKINRLYYMTANSGAPMLLIGDMGIPLDDHGNAFVNFSFGPEEIPRISASDIMEGNIPEGSLREKSVILGCSAAGLEQVFRTPGRAVFSSAEIHADLLETLLTGGIAVRNRDFVVWEITAGLLLAMGMCFLVTGTPIIWSVSGGAFAFAALWAGARIAFHTSGMVFSPLYPSLVILVNLSVLIVFKNRKELLRAEKKTGDALVLLKTSEKTLDSIIRRIPDIVFRLDQQGRIVFVSHAVSRYGRKPEDFLGRPIFELVKPEDRETARLRINERRTGDRATADLELRLMFSGEKACPEGEGYRYFKVSAEGIYKDEGSGSKAYVGTQAIARDISDQKEMEERLQRAQRMEAVGSLAGAVAHDLNNILSGLVSYPDLILLDLPPGSPLRDKICRIKQSGEKAAAVVKDLLTLARRGVSVSEVFNLNEAISEFLSSPEFADVQSAHPRVRLETQLAGDLMDVKGSAVHLSKAIMNLVGNAAEAMPSGGRILITSENRYIDTPFNAYELIPEGEYVIVKVMDEGIGIAAQDVSKIFEPFYTKKHMRKSGTGLGMTVIWTTIKDHNGYIDIQSAEGEGTSFSLFLPATREAADVKKGRVVLEDYLGSERILIVDDSAEQLEIAVKMLTKLGYSVSCVQSGEEAVEFVKAEKVDLVVLDMIMPGGIDGLETYRRMVSVSPGQKAIVASGYSESERVRELIKLGAGSYVQKPYTLEKIGIAVRQELDRKRA